MNIDGICGVAVGLFIARAGIGAAMDTISPLLGNPASVQLVEQIRNCVMKHDGIIGIHDLVVHDYGPGRFMISLHAEVPASGNILEIHDLIDNIEQELENELSLNELDMVAAARGTTYNPRQQHPDEKK